LPPRPRPGRACNRHRYLAPRAVKIQDIQVVNLRFDYTAGVGFRYAGGQETSRVTSLVLVETDSGETGVGAAYSHPDLVKTIIEQHLAPHLIGRDPTEPERLWGRLYDLTRWYGRKGAAVSAIGGLDIACWALGGKHEGAPVWQLLGASVDSCPAYASGLFWTDDVDELEAEAA